MPGVEIGLSQKKKKKDPSANLFLIKYLTCQNYRQLMFLRLSAGLGTAFPMGWGIVGWFWVPVTLVLSSLTPRDPKPSPDLARFLWVSDPPSLLEGRCLLGQMQNPGASPIITSSSHAFGAPRIEKVLWRNELYFLWTPGNASDCFRNLGWLYLPPWSSEVPGRRFF